MTEQHTADLATPCIDWEGAIDSDGYGRKQTGGKWASAHRLAYQRQVGPIPPELQIDHLCRNRRCVNVLHMELVTIRQNVLRGQGITAKNARKTYCLRGHPLSGTNLRISSSGERICKECGRVRWRAYRSRKIKQGSWTR